MPVPPPNEEAVRHNRARRLLLVAVAVIAVCGLLLWLGLRNRTDVARDDALKAANQGRFAEVEAILHAAHQRNPQDVEVVEALARGYLNAKNATEAEKYLTRWVELRPDDPNVRRMRFDFYREAKDRENAFADGKTLLELEKKYALEKTGTPAHRDAALAPTRRIVMTLAFSLGRFEDAEALCHECLLDTPEDRNLRSMLAEIRVARGDLAGAGAILDQLLKDFPTYTPAMLARGILYLETGEPEKAIPLFREVLATDRTRQRTTGAQLVIALERTGQVEEAKRVAAEVRKMQDVEVYTDALRSQPENLEIQVRLAERLLADGHTKEGMEALNAVLAIEPRNRAAHLAFAAHYEKQGQPAKAAEHRKLAGSTP